LERLTSSKLRFRTFKLDVEVLFGEVDVNLVEVEVSRTDVQSILGEVDVNLVWGRGLQN